MNLAERYTWEAEKGCGTVIRQEDETQDPIRTVGDLTECVRFSLLPVPNDPDPLPRIDLAGVPLKRRFGRGFLRLNDAKKNEYIYCIVCEGYRVYIRCTDGRVIITPENCDIYL